MKLEVNSLTFPWDKSLMVFMKSHRVKYPESSQTIRFRWADITPVYFPWCNSSKISNLSLLLSSLSVLAYINVILIYSCTRMFILPLLSTVSDYGSSNLCVCVSYSCMDTSSKTWLPHQSQFGLVGQAEVCCGGPGVLTPSESVRPHTGGSLFFTSVNCARTSLLASLSWSNETYFSVIYVFSVLPAAPSEVHQQHNNGEFNMLSGLLCTIAFQAFSELWSQSTWIYWGFFPRSILHRSITHPLSPSLSHPPSFILTSSRFDSAICLFIFDVLPWLWYTGSLPPLCSSLLPPQMKAAISASLQGREGK